MLTRQDGVQRIHRPLGHAILDVQHFVSDQTAVSLAVAAAEQELVAVVAVKAVSARGRRRLPQRFGHLEHLARHKTAHHFPTRVRTAVDRLVDPLPHQLGRSNIACRACAHCTGTHTRRIV